MNKSLEELEKGIERIQEILEKIGASKELIEKKVVTFGNGGHIIIPKEHVNKKATVIFG